MTSSDFPDPTNEFPDPIAAYPDARSEFPPPGSQFPGTALSNFAVMDDFNDGDLAEWDQTDTWSTSTTHAYEGSHGVHLDNTTGSLEVMIALAGSLNADFSPGEVMHFLYKEVGTSESFQIYFGKQDTTDTDNCYRFQLRVTGGDGGYDVSKRDAGDTGDSEFIDEGAVNGLPSGGAWGHGYIYWHPENIADDPDNTSSPASDGTAEGDFFIEVQDDNGVPKMTSYVNADDLTFTDGGIGIRINDAENLAFDLFEKGDPSDFADFNPTNHIPGTNDIATFEHGDMRAWESTFGNRWEIVGSNTVTAAFGDYCAEYAGGTGFTESVSLSDGSGSGQDKTLPNYLADGEKGAFYLRTDDATVDELYLGVAAADANNYVRVELDWGDRFRVLEFVGGTANALASDGTFTGSANTWYELIADRATTSGSITFDLNTKGGTNVSELTVNPDSTLDGNDGFVVGGSNSNGANFYYDQFEMR